MRLEPLYRVRFTYPESWSVGLDGGWQQMFFMAEGRCEGSVTGRFRGANFPRKEGADGPFRPDFRAVIETDDGAVIMVEWHGYGRAYPLDRRQIVGSVFHLADLEPYRRLNDAVCVCVGEVRAATDPGQAGPDLVMDVAELRWEPIADESASPGERRRAPSAPRRVTPSSRHAPNAPLWVMHRHRQAGRLSGP